MGWSRWGYGGYQSGSLSHNHNAPVVCEKISGLSAKGGASSLYSAFLSPVPPSRSRISQQLARKFLPQRVTSLHLTPLIPPAKKVTTAILPVTLHYNS
jgi:hypothetical protein